MSDLNLDAFRRLPIVHPCPTAGRECDLDTRDDRGHAHKVCDRESPLLRWPSRCSGTPRTVRPVVEVPMGSHQNVEVREVVDHSRFSRGSFIRSGWRTVLCA